MTGDRGNDWEIVIAADGEPSLRRVRPARDPLGWHVIEGAHLLDLLRRAHAGEDPDLLLAEAWANADHGDHR